MSEADGPAGGRHLVARVFAAATAAGLAAALLDLTLPGLLAPGAGPRLDFRNGLYLLGLGALGGLILALIATIGVTAAILAGRGRRLSYRHPGVVLMALALVAVFVLVNRRTFSGARISIHPHVGLFRVGFLVLGGAAIFAVTRGVAGIILFLDRARPEWRRIGGTLGLLGGIGIFAIDATVLPGLYPQLHLQCAAVSFSLLSFGFLVLGLPRNIRGWRGLVVVVALSLSAALLRVDPAIAGARAEIAGRAVSLRQWMALPESVLGLFTPLPPPPMAGASDGILAAREHDRLTAQDLGPRLDGLVPGRREMNLLIISVDSLRQDHMSSAGYQIRTGRRTTPNLDALAARSLVFPRCYTTYPTSAWAYSSLLSGRDAPVSPFAAVLENPEVTFPTSLTLPGLLESQGFLTAAVAAFNAGTTAARTLFGHLGEGFHVFDRNRSPTAEGAAAITDDAVRELDLAAARRFFLWVHYLDPHEPYTHHPESDFGPSPVGRYDSEIAHCDAQIGRLLAELDRRGLAPRTIVVAMSDHGEAFGEHHGYRHDSSLYDEQIRVPLLIAAPGLPPGSVDAVASLADVLPTLAQIFAIDDPFLRSGRSLLPAALGVAIHEGWARAVLNPDWSSTGRDLEALVHGRLKLIVDRGRQVEELYDLLADPGEGRNLLLDSPAEAAILRGLLGAVRARDALILLPAEGAPPPPLPPATRVRNGLDHLATLRPETATEAVCAAATMLRHPVFGLSPEFTGSLGPRESEELSLRLRSLADPSNDVSTQCILGLLSRLENPQDLAFARCFRTSSLRLFLENSALRGILGDRDAIPELTRLLDAPTAPDRHLAASALLSLGERPALEVALAVSESRLPFEVSRILRGLGRIRAGEILPLAADLLDHPHWREFGPVRLELAAALAGFPVSPLRERLLARLAHDVEPEVVRRALKALQTSHPDELCHRWLAVGENEADAARSLLHGNVAASAAALARAVSLLPDPELRAAEAVARLRHFLGVPGVPAATGTSESLRIEAYLTGEFPFEVQGVVVPPRALTEAWYFLKLRVVNTGSEAWPGPEAGVGFELRPELATPGGRIVCGDVPMDHRLPRAGVPPGGAIEVLLPICTPDTPGRLLLNLRLVRRFPDGAVRVDASPTATGVFLDVFAGLPLEDALPH